MVSNGEPTQRGGAIAAGSLRRRRSGSTPAGGAAKTMLQFYTDDTTGRRISPNTVLIMSVGFIAVVALLHVFGKLHRVHS